MKKITLAVSVCMTLSIQAYAGGDMVAVEPMMIMPMIEEDIVPNDWFVYIAGGVSTLDVTSSVSSTGRSNIFPDSLDDKGSLVELGLGYRVSENVFTTLAGQRTNLDFVTLDTVYASLNYQFVDVMLKPYIGVLAGYSKLHWDTRPHTPHQINPFVEDLTSTAGVYGAQIGIEQTLNENWSLFGKYQYLKYNEHVMDIDETATTIEHNSAQNILGGIRYAF